MDKKQIKKELKRKRKLLSKKKTSAIMTQSIKDHSKFIYAKNSIDLVMAMEEMAELSQETSKYIRGKGDKQHLAEEIGDVYNALEMIKIVTGISDEDVDVMKDIKFRRQDKRNKEFKKSKDKDKNRRM